MNRLLGAPGCSSLCGNRSRGILKMKSGITIPICDECKALLASLENKYFSYIAYTDENGEAKVEVEIEAEAETVADEEDV